MLNGTPSLLMEQSGAYPLACDTGAPPHLFGVTFPLGYLAHHSAVLKPTYMKLKRKSARQRDLLNHGY